MRRFIKRRIEQEQGSFVVSLAENQEGSWTYTMPPGMHAMIKPLAKRLNLSVPDAISRILLDWCQRRLAWSVDWKRQQHSLIHEEHNATGIEEQLKQMIDHEESKLVALKSNLSRLEKIGEAENLPDVISLMKNEIIKVEGTLNDLREAYEGAKIYIELMERAAKGLPRC